MYNKFFGFKEKPFKLVPNPAYFYLSKSHEEAMAHLNYAISQGDGFVEITGEVGTGKTTLCRTFLESLNGSVEAAYIFNPKMGPKQLLRTIIEEFGIQIRSDNTKDLIDLLNAFLIQKKASGKKVILVIDEAQNLTPHEIKTIITRVGDGTKIVVTGDPYQIDNPYIDSSSNGLTYVVERFKTQKIAAHLTFTKGERSKLSELAANLL